MCEGFVATFGSKSCLQIQFCFLSFCRIHELSLHGELKKFHDKWWNNITVECEVEAASSLVPIDFYTIGGAFCLILIGFALGYIGMFVEYLFSRKKKVVLPKKIDFRSLKLGHRPAPYPH